MYAKVTVSKGRHNASDRSYGLLRQSAIGLESKPGLEAIAWSGELESFGACEFKSRRGRLFMGL